jgi:hypothetical protein
VTDFNVIINSGIRQMLWVTCIYMNASIPYKTLNSIMAFIMSVFFVLLLVGVYVKSVNSHQFYWSLFAEVVWVFHSCLVYILLSLSVKPGSDLHHAIRDAISPELLSWRLEVTKKVDVPFISYEYVSRRTVGLCVAISLVNEIVIIISHSNDLLSRILPWSNHKLWNVFGMFMWYFYSFHWFSAIVFIYIPVHFLGRRLQCLYDAFSHLDGSSREDVLRAFDWYDDLFRVNRTIQAGVELITTLSISVLCVLVVCMSVVSFCQILSPLSYSHPTPPLSTN